MRFSPTFLDEIRDRLPISSVIGQRVSWDRRKTNASKGDYWACCPFHGEKSPSFHCEDRKGRYHCFGCGVSGDHFRFLTELDGLSFPEAVERIADMAGGAMPARAEQAEATRRLDAEHGRVGQLQGVEQQATALTLQAEKLRADLSILSAERDSLAALLAQKDSQLQVQSQQAERSLRTLQLKVASLERSLALSAVSADAAPLATQSSRYTPLLAYLRGTHVL